MTKKKRKQILQLSGLHIFYIILCLLALVPILYALNLSFERGSGALSSGLSLFPKEFTLDNYKNTWCHLMHFQDTVLREEMAF